MSEKYESVEIHFSNGETVLLNDAIISEDKKEYLVFTVENQRWWFNLSEVSYTVVTSDSLPKQLNI